MGWDLWNLIETIGAFALAFSVLVFMWNMVTSMRNGRLAGNDPWDAATLEWATESPPPGYNFEKIPTVYSRRPLWDTKYPDLEVAHTPGTHAMKRSEVIARERDRTEEQVEEGPIHLPSPTYYPLILAAGLTVAAFGSIYRWPGITGPLPDPRSWLSIPVFVGLAIMFFGIIGWVRDAHKDAPH
jgi:cytochrome c oxidase subunit 1